MMPFLFRGLIVAWVVLISSCSRSYMVKTESNFLEVKRVNLLTVQYHRPSYPPADRDDFSNKNRVLECQSPVQLWSETLSRSSSVNECLNSIQAGSVIYFYMPETQPYLLLDAEEESNPKCLQTELPKIPLPREVYYLAAKVGTTPSEEFEQDCYASSFSLKTNQLMNTPTGFLKKKIKIDFPLDRPLNHAQDLRLWLTITTFTILKSDEDAIGRLLASPVPDGLCRQCFKADSLFDDKFRGKIKPVFWP